MLLRPEGRRAARSVFGLASAATSSKRCSISDNGQDATFFKVRADDGNLFIFHDVSNDEWGLEAFRELKK